MPDKSTVDKLLEHAPLALIVMGVILIVIGASGGLTIGNLSLKIADAPWRLGVCVFGSILSMAGVVLLVLESELSGFAKRRIRRFDCPEDAWHYTFKRMREAKKSVCDLSWEKPLKTPLIFTDADAENYLSIIEEVSRRIRYREIMMFCESENRVKKVRKLLQTAGKYYQLAGYADLPREAPTRWQFVIIDDEEVILHNLAVKQPDIVGYFRRYYDALWVAATPIKTGDVEPNLELLEEAEKRVSEAKRIHPKSIARGHLGDKAKSEIADLREIMYDSVCFPVGTGPSCIFHAQCPYVLPICFKSPMRSEYTYIVVGTRVEDASTEDEREYVITEPGLSPHSINSATIRRGRWYQVTSAEPLESIRFGDGPRIEEFAVVEAEIHPVGAWNKHSPVTIPGSRQRAYGLAITEQKGPSTWFVSSDDQVFTFSQNLGCHFVEFVLPDGRQHSVAFGHQEGPWGIACAFFAF